MNQLAIVVVPVQPPPPPPAITGCAFQVRLNDDTYQCFTQQQWNERQRQEDLRVAQQREAYDHFLDTHHWLLWSGAALVALLIIWRIIYVIKHPKDEWGNRR